MNLFYLFPRTPVIPAPAGEPPDSSFDVMKVTDTAEQIVPAVWFGMVAIWRTR
jgi:hypothetical protein